MRLARVRKRGKKGWLHVLQMQDIEVLPPLALKKNFCLAADEGNILRIHALQPISEEILRNSLFPPRLIRKAVGKVVCSFYG